MAAEEDVDMVVRSQFFPNKRGIIVDVGAARPDYLSISASFREAGWKVIAIEPNPDFCAAHRAVGNEVLQYAVSDKDIDEAEFFVVDSHGAEYQGGPVSFESFSSLGIKGKYAELHETTHVRTSVKTINVKVRKLDTILADHHPETHHVDIVAVDVEGWELNVMRGFSLNRYRPKVVILENLFDSLEYVEYMKQCGYSLWSKLAPNDVYVRDKEGVQSSHGSHEKNGEIMGIEAATPPASPAMISYAQNREDVLLDRVFKDAATGFYIDIGAYHPMIGSVTKTFYDRGWSGINVEPGAVFDELARERPRDTNVRAVVIDQEGEVDFFENQSDPGMSKVAEGPVMADGEGEMLRVRAVTLDSLVAQHAIGQEINFLKIDAEGSEAAIIRATNWSLIRPLVLVIEATAPWSNELVNQNWEPTLLASGFLRAYFDGINVFYVRAESKELLRHFQVPVNVLDSHMTFEQWHSSVAVEQLTAERSQIIAERDQFSAECEAQRQKSAEIQKRSVELTAAIEQAEAESQRLTAHAAALSKRLAQEQKQAEAERKRLTAQAAALSTQLEKEHQQAGAEGMRLTTHAAALSEQLEQERERAEEEGRRLMAHVAALSKQLEQERHSLASATSLAARYDRLVLELRDEGGPRALGGVLPLARLLRRFHHAVGRDNATHIAPTESSMVSPASFEPPSSPAPDLLRSTVKKGALGVYKVLFRPFVRPVMWRVRTFLLQPVYERLDRSYETLHHARSDEIQALRQEQAQLARSLENHARSDDIQALRQEQAQLVRSLETLALTIASNPRRER